MEKEIAEKVLREIKEKDCLVNNDACKNCPYGVGSVNGYYCEIDDFINKIKEEAILCGQR